MTPWSYDIPPPPSPAVRRLRLATVTAVWAISLVIITLVLAWALFSHQLWRGMQGAEGQRVENVARAVAAWPIVVAALQAGPPYTTGSTLERRVERLRRASDLDFIVVMDHRAIRLTHPDVSRIGQHFRGDDEADALTGQAYVSIARGTLGRSVRGFAPVTDETGRVIGAVSVGVRLAALSPLYTRSHATLIAGLGVIGLIGALGAAGLARRIKTQLGSMEPPDIAALVAEHRAVLDGVHEGLIVVGMDRRIRLINPAARRLLAPSVGQSLEIGMPLDDPRRGDATDEAIIDRPLTIAGRRFRGSLQRVGPADAPLGCVLSFRDTAELQRLGEELTGVRRYADALRGTQHETKNRLHVILGLAELGDTRAIVDYVTRLTQTVTDSSDGLVDQVGEPVLGGFLLAKQAEARALQVDLSIEIENTVPPAADRADIHRLVGVLGNLIDNAFDATAASDVARVHVTLAHEDDMLALSVSDTGEGMTEAQRRQATHAGYTTRGTNRGVGLSLVVRHLADVGQTLSIYSTVGEGTLIEAALPFATT